MTASPPSPAYRTVTLWLTLCCAGVVWMVAIGGWTRLTESGLSMTDWRPITGVFPPLTEQDWQDEFNAYKASPQYQLLNHGIAIEDFQLIFWPEFLHRLSGRIVGLLFFLPFLYFFIRRSLPARVKSFCFIAAAAGCLQGGIGWWMVKSGLSNAPYVSHYRLAFHLGMAFFIFAMLYLARLRITMQEGKIYCRRMIAAWALLFNLTVIQIILGAFVAGKNAGHAFNDFPLMNGAFIPTGVVALWPNISAALSDPVTLHVLHRISGYILLITAYSIACALTITKHQYARYFSTIAILLTAQAALGAWTVISNVDIIAAILHQLFALGLFAFFIKTGYVLMNRKDS